MSEIVSSSKIVHLPHRWAFHFLIETLPNKRAVKLQDDSWNLRLAVLYAEIECTCTIDLTAWTFDDLSKHEEEQFDMNDSKLHKHKKKE